MNSYYMEICIKMTINLFRNVCFQEFAIPVVFERLSNTGNPAVFNGMADVCAGVEIEEDDTLLYWSPDANYLAFATLVHVG